MVVLFKVSYIQESQSERLPVNSNLFLTFHHIPNIIEVCIVFELFIKCNTFLDKIGLHAHVIGFSFHVSVQFKMAGLSVFSNNWGTIHDFSQDPDEQHYSLLPEVLQSSCYIKCYCKFLKKREELTSA